MNTAITRLSIFNLTDFVQSADANFTGRPPEPAAAISTTHSRIVWAKSTQAGMIDLDSLGLTGSYKICHISLSMAGQDTFSINLVDGGTSIVMASGTTATSYHATNLGYLTGGQKLQVVTTGASTTAVKMVVGLADTRANVVS